MADFTLTDQGKADQITGAPGGCSLCGNIDGPYVLVLSSKHTFQSNAGPISSDEHLQFCAPKRDPGNDSIILRQGCVGTMAAMVGYVGPEVLAGAQESIADGAARQRELEAENKKLKKSQVNVVPVSELMSLIETSKPSK